MIKKETWAMVIGISFVPAVWAVIANHIGVEIAATAMISACPYVLAGKTVKDSLSMTVGLLLGIVWTRITFLLMSSLTFNADIVTFVVLVVMVALAIIISSFAPKAIHCVSWLCGFALGLTVLGLSDVSAYNIMSLKLALAMIVGDWCVGFLGSKIIGACMKAFNKNSTAESKE